MSISAYTATYAFRLINFDSPRWHTDDWANWQALDATLRSIGALSNKGVWSVATSYIAGDRVADATNGLIYQCAVAHTSASSGTFAADRTTNPTYWKNVTQVPNYRDVWATATSYSVGDIVALGTNKWYFCLVSHTSGVFAADNAAGYWALMFDFSSFTSYYYGSRATETNLRPDGTASQAGDVYYNTGSSQLRLYNGSSWTNFNSAGSTASGVTFTPTGGVAATNVQSAIAEVDSEKANIASPTFTGTPASVTAAVDTNTTQIATCAFVINQGYLKSTTAAATYVTIATAAATYLAKASNLSDLGNVGTARSNLGVYSTTQVDTIAAGKANTSHTHVVADITNLGTISIPGMFKNLVITNGATPNSQVLLTADFVSATNGTNIAVGAVSATISTASAGAVNALDTGVVAANTWYSVWAIFNGTTWGGLLSTSATTPTMPSGYTYKVRLGWVRTDGSSNLYRTKQMGRIARYIITPTSNTSGFPSMASGVAGNPSTPTYVAVSVSAFVPTTASMISYVVGITAAGTVTLAPNNSYGVFNTSVASPVYSADGTIATSAYGDLMLETTNIYWASNGAGGFLNCRGWEDNL